MEVEIAEKRTHFFNDLAAGCPHKTFNSPARKFETSDTTKFPFTSPHVASSVSSGVLIEHDLHGFLEARRSIIPIADDLVQKYPEERLQIIRNFMGSRPRIQ
jgi:hypothetical protein